MIGIYWPRGWTADPIFRGRLRCAVVAPLPVTPEAAGSRNYVGEPSAGHGCWAPANGGMGPGLPRDGQELGR
jgi:hypothetical protein